MGIYVIIQIICLSWFLTFANDFINEANEILKNKKNIFKIPTKILQCIKCTAFHVTLIWTQDFLLATQISLLAFLLDKYIISTNIKL